MNCPFSTSFFSLFSSLSLSRFCSTRLFLQLQCVSMQINNNGYLHQLYKHSVPFESVGENEREKKNGQMKYALNNSIRLKWKRQHIAVCKSLRVTVVKFCWFIFLFEVLFFLFFFYILFFFSVISFFIIEFVRTYFVNEQYSCCTYFYFCTNAQYVYECSVFHFHVKFEINKEEEENRFGRFFGENWKRKMWRYKRLRTTQSLISHRFFFFEIIA